VGSGPRLSVIAGLDPAIQRNRIGRSFVILDRRVKAGDDSRMVNRMPG
jgi:hypothetical protein